MYSTLIVLICCHRASSSVTDAPGCRGNYVDVIVLAQLHCEKTDGLRLAEITIRFLTQQRSSQRLSRGCDARRSQLLRQSRCPQPISAFHQHWEGPGFENHVHLHNVTQQQSSVVGNVYLSLITYTLQVYIM